MTAAAKVTVEPKAKSKAKAKAKAKAEKEDMEESSSKEKDQSKVKDNDKAKGKDKVKSKAEPDPSLTKRQRRKKVNDTHKWPQHPKIQSMDARNNAYLRVAGFGEKSNKSSSSSSSTIDPKLDLMSPEVKFGRLLGSTDQRQRHAAVQKLQEYLVARCDVDNDNGGLSELDLLRLWKGMWYTLYMADKVPVQDELSKRLAKLIWCVAGTDEEDEYAGREYLNFCRDQEEQLQAMLELEQDLDETEDQDDGEKEEDDEEEEEDSDDSEYNIEEIVNTLAESDDEDDDEDAAAGDDDDEDQDGEEIPSEEVRHCRGAHLASLFASTFFRTVRNQWSNMDKYRVDKFYTLIRLFVHEIYKYMAQRHWNAGIIRLFNDRLYDDVLSHTPNGIRYHLIDVSLEELAKVNSEAPMPLTEATFLDVMEPYFMLTQNGAGDGTVHSRVMEQVLEKFLDEFCAISDRALKAEEEDDEETHSIIFSDVHVGTVAKFIFDIASNTATSDRYRKTLYDMHKRYQRRMKLIGKDVEIPSAEDVLESSDKGAVVSDDDDVNMEEASAPEETHDESESDDKTEQVVTPSSGKKKRKKKKKKTKVDDDQKDDISSAREEKIDEESNNDLKKKSKRDKKKSKKEGGGAKKKVEIEEEISISVAEQKQAASAEKNRKGKRKKQKESPEPDMDSPSKRVKFSSKNEFKSWKASMKALDKPKLKPSSATPEKSILLNKGAPSPVAKPAPKRSRRARALDYF